MWILVVDWINGRGKRVVTVIQNDEDMPQVFPTLQAAEACAWDQPMCKAYGALAVNVDTGETERV